jgi:uncharacterized protein (DUF1330 family)
VEPREDRLAAVAGEIAAAGAEAIYAGSAVGTLIGDEIYDLAAVVRYPSRRALAALVRDPAFAATTPLRHAALEGGLLYAFA